jgi:hypothetical protein
MRFCLWKPLPREIDAKLMTLIPDFMKSHTSVAAGLKSGQFNRERNLISFMGYNLPNKPFNQ